VEREILKEPLREDEVRALAKRVPHVRDLVRPMRAKETAHLSDAELIPHLAKNPGDLRRPIIDTGSALYLGFDLKVQEALGAKKGKK
jgi:arsenate reductase-like glutaredoxin family protein